MERSRLYLVKVRAHCVCPCGLRISLLRPRIPFSMSGRWWAGARGSTVRSFSGLMKAVSPGTAITDCSSISVLHLQSRESVCAPYKNETIWSEQQTCLTHYLPAFKFHGIWAEQTERVVFVFGLGNKEEARKKCRCRTNKPGCLQRLANGTFPRGHHSQQRWDTSGSPCHKSLL